MHSEFLSETEPQKETAQALAQSRELIQRLVEASASTRQALLVA